GKRSKNGNINNQEPDVQLVDVTNNVLNNDKKYLIVKLVKEEPDIANIENLSKRKKDESIVEKLNKRKRLCKIIE
ncbi:363_t:CDS:1, partial [Cetraspora pellucida]